MMTVLAHEVPDLTRKGSIEVTMYSEGEPVPGGTLTIFRVGSIQEQDGNFCFALTEEFADFARSLDDVHAAGLAADLAEYARECGAAGTTGNIDENGYAVFQNLELGLYLCVQQEAAPGFAPVSPFLVSVPAVVDGAYVYDVQAGPKVGQLIPVETEATEPPTTEPADPQLPQTGQLHWPVYVMSTLGVLLCFAGWVLLSDSRNLTR